jgi:hypothetical protein
MGRLLLKFTILCNKGEPLPVYSISKKDDFLFDKYVENIIITDDLYYKILENLTLIILIGVLENEVEE